MHHPICTVSCCVKHTALACGQALCLWLVHGCRRCKVSAGMVLCVLGRCWLLLHAGGVPASQRQ